MDGGPDEQQGIIPRAFVHIFETVEASSDTQWMVRASFLEIYNEEVRAPAHCAVSLRRRSLRTVTMGWWMEYKARPGCPSGLLCPSNVQASNPACPRALLRAHTTPD